MLLAGGLGRRRVKPGTFTVPAPAGVTFEASDALSVELESSAILSGLHPTLPIELVRAVDTAFLLNGLDPIRKYNGTNVRKAFTLAPVRPPTVTVSAFDAEMDGPADIAVVTTATGDSHAYIADTNNHRILKLDAITGEYLDEYGTYGTGDSNLDGPVSVASDGTYLYICDYGNDRVVKVTISTLAYSAKVTVNSPAGIATDGTYVWIASDSTGDDDVYRMTVAFGSSTSYGAGLNNPTSVGYDAAGDYLFIADTGAHRIVQCTGAFANKTPYGSRGSGQDQFESPLGVATDGNQVFICDSLNNRIVSADIVAHSSTPTWSAEGGSMGSGAAGLRIPFGIEVSGGKLYIGDGFNDQVPIYKASTLTYESITFATEIEDYSIGTRAWTYLYVDEDGNKTAESPVTEKQYGGSINATVSGFHSTDPKVAYIERYCSKFDFAADRYLHSTIVNNPAGTTWSFIDVLDDDSIGDVPYRTPKREGIHGLPQTCLTGCVWRDIFFMAGAIIVPDYSVGQGTVAAAWDASRGLWKVTGSSTTRWTEKMIGRTFIEASDTTKKAAIVDVDETNQHLWLCVAWTGTTGSAINYIVRDERRVDGVFHSEPGLYEDFSADNFIPIDLGSGDELLALYPFGERIIVFCKNSVGLISGTNKDNFSYRRLTKAAGIDSSRSLVEFSVEGAGSILAFWRFPTIYALGSGMSEPEPWSTFIEPALAETMESAAERAVAWFNKASRVLYVCMGTPTDIANSDCYTFEESSRTWSREPGPRMSAAGEFRDVNGRYTMLYLDEWGVLWQPGVGNAEGAFAGDLTGNVESWGLQTLGIHDSVSTFDPGLVGVPVFTVFDDGTYERNIILASSMHNVFLAWQPSVEPDTDTQVVIGGIEHLLESPALDAGVPEVRQRFRTIFVDHEETAGTVLLEAATDEGSFSPVTEMDFSKTSPRGISLSGALRGFSGFMVRFRWSSLIPGNNWRLRGYSYVVAYRRTRGRN